ncbi:hypothetical protein EDC96DRAFT_120350 [Choanephora cucurbitarum]|nr:hypothetical protein EDC96DRAFT_120350 [Choanephora cucurbitarum]
MNTSKPLGFHQRKSSLTTLCPPTDKRSFDLNKRQGSHSLRTDRSFKRQLLNIPITQLIGWTYMLVCLCLSTFHLLVSFSSLDQVTHHPRIDWNKVLEERQYNTSWSQLNHLLPEARLAKVFSKSNLHRHTIRPHWFTASIKPSRDALTLTTVVEPRQLDQLTRLSQLYQGPISATLLVSNSPLIQDHLDQIRSLYETTPALRRHVDLHLILQSGSMATGNYQEARNLARLFSRTGYIAMLPVDTLWMTSISHSFKQYSHLLHQGDLLILPTFGFPQYDGVRTDEWPEDKLSMLEWVHAGEMGLLDDAYELNNGPTSYSTWKQAKEPYQVPNYDFNYGPIFISTLSSHPWCDERFEDFLPSCIYKTYLSGANLWVLPNDYAVRTGQVSNRTLFSEQQHQIQKSIAKRYRLEQCVYYARQFDQHNTFHSSRADHVKQECSRSVLSLQKQKMISNVIDP